MCGLIWASRSDLCLNQKVRELGITDETTELKKKKCHHYYVPRIKMSLSDQSPQLPQNWRFGTLAPGGQLPPSGKFLPDTINSASQGCLSAERGINQAGDVSNSLPPSCALATVLGKLILNLEP